MNKIMQIYRWRWRNCWYIINQKWPIERRNSKTSI